MKLSESLADLQKLVDAIEQCQENGEPIPETLVPEIQTSVEAFKESVDKRISVIENLDWYSKFIDEKAKELQKKARTLKNALESIKEHTKWQIEQNPELDWKGSVKKLTLQKSVQGKEWRIKTDELKNIIPVECLDYVPKKYYREHVVYLLDKDLVNQDLKDKPNELFNVCRLKDKTTHLRIR